MPNGPSNGTLKVARIVSWILRITKLHCDETLKTLLDAMLQARDVGGFLKHHEALQRGSSWCLISRTPVIRLVVQGLGVGFRV